MNTEEYNELKYLIDNLTNKVNYLADYIKGPVNSTASLSHCGCYSWTDGLGNEGKFYCPEHRNE